ncbi:MAG: hypothetical protein IKQ54_05345 [Oscillospiraceae bacterium]|nr:hypothetical protein [Oscillospiraceae bacterium]MBR4193735.1 hypothetical protein [Oscillospiraceae bacterium]
MDIGWVVSIIAGLAAIAFGYAAFSRNKKNDDTEEGKTTGSIMSELGYIKSGVDDVKRKQEKSDETIMGFLKDLTAVQESAKQAHKRIDTLEDRLNTKP